MQFTSELALFLKARYPIIYINTIEEDRVEYIIRKNIKTNLNRSIYSWDFVDGYTNNPNNEGFSLTNKKAQRGPKTDSDNMIIPTIAEGVVLAPVVININPRPT